MRLVDVENPHDPVGPFILACERVIQFASERSALEEESWEAFKFRARDVIHAGPDPAVKRAA